MPRASSGSITCKSGKSTDLTGAASPCGSTRDDGGCRGAVATDPKFSPDSHYISFIRDHGLVVRPVPSGKHKRSTNRETELGERRPTGASESVWNGEVDWVYEEELDVRSNYFWSPDSRHIAYLEMDESEVPEYPIVDWLSREVKIDRQRYPKAGERNPGVRIGVADLDGHSKWLSFTAETDIYHSALRLDQSESCLGAGAQPRADAREPVFHRHRERQQPFGLAGNR